MTRLCPRNLISVGQVLASQERSLASHLKVSFFVPPNAAPAEAAVRLAGPVHAADLT